MQVRSQQGDTLDRLLWRHLGTTAGAVEAGETITTPPGMPALLAAAMVAPVHRAPTMAVPPMSAIGITFCGFFTSPATVVAFVQPS